MALADVYKDKIKAEKEMVEQLKVQWKLLWSERFNDKTRAEDVSLKNYASLHVEQGHVIHATRDYKALNFKEILDQNMIENSVKFIQPNSREGGWNKFVKTKIYPSSMKKDKFSMLNVTKKQAAQKSNKAKQGWLHLT